MAEARPAATVVVLRQGSAGPEVLLLLRSKRVGFFPDAWVFPGGRVDPDDSLLPVRGRVPGLPDADRAFAVAALRECFEETGVWLGAGQPPVDLRLALIARRASLLAVPGLVADLDALRLWSWWVTPEGEPRRFDTRFFLATLAPGAAGDVGPDGEETVAAEWVPVHQALSDCAVDGRFMAPPTFRTLEELARFRTTDRIWAAAAARQVREVRPILRRDLPGVDGWGVLLPGDPEHPDPQPVEGGTRIVLRAGRWVSEGSAR